MQPVVQLTRMAAAGRGLAQWRVGVSGYLEQTVKHVFEWWFDEFSKGLDSVSFACMAEQSSTSTTTALAALCKKVKVKKKKKNSSLEVLWWAGNKSHRDNDLGTFLFLWSPEEGSVFRTLPNMLLRMQQHGNVKHSIPSFLPSETCPAL